MRKLFLLVLSFICFQVLNAQIGVAVTGNTNATPNLQSSYASLSAALTDLNAVTALSGPITLTLAAGSSETAPVNGFTIGSATLNPVLSATNNITLVKASGAATTINAGVGTATPSSAAPDGMLKIVGADYVTIDGLTFNDANAANPATMEYGIALFKLSLNDGAQNNTIRNCNITLNRINNASSTAPMIEGSVGILMINSIPTAATTVLSPTTAAGSNSNNKFYSNTIQNCNYGIGLSGFAATTPFTAGDTGNDIGGNSVSTGNTILNYGGGGTANPASGIRANNQWGINISYNTINNNNGSGVNHGTTLRGIFAQAGTSANATITFNNVSVKGGATSSSVSAIENGIGSTAAANTIQISNNTIQNCTYTTATTATFNGILNTSTAATVVTSNNTISNNSIGSSATTSACTFYGIYSSSGPTNHIASNNTITGNTVLNQAGSLYCIRGVTSLLTWNNNTISNNGFPNSGGTSSASVYGLYDGSSPTQEFITGNQISNLYVTGSSTSTGSSIYGIYFNTAASSVKNITNNLVSDLTHNNSSTGASTVYGIYSALGATVNISKNKIYNLVSQGASGSVLGLVIASGTTVIAQNNLVGQLSTPSANAANPLIGISVGGGTTVSLYYNTVFISGSSTGALFGSSAISASTTPTLEMRNNIFANTSTTSGAGLAVAYRRSGTTLSSYAAASNNNLFYAPTIYTDGTTPATTLADYKTAMATRDQSSVTENIVSSFVSTSGASNGFLHIANGTVTQAESGGSAVTGITDDFDGDIRQGNAGYAGTGTKPDIGADEFNGTSPAPVINSVAVTPTGNLCNPSSRTVTASVSPTGAAISTVTINYSVEGVLQTPIAMTNTGGNNWSGTIPAAAAGSIVTWYVTATDASNIATLSASSSYEDAPLTGATANINATATTICNGTATNLSGSVNAQGNVTLGTGATTSSTYSNPFYSNWGHSKNQVLIKASELQALGMGQGNIYSITFETTSGTTALTDFSLQIGHSSANDMNNFVATALTSVYTAATFTPVVGLNTITFTTPFVWDGVSNIILQTCWGNNNTTTVSNTMRMDNTSYVSTAHWNSTSTTTATAACGQAAPSATYNLRPKIVFNATINFPIASYSWSDGTTTVGTTQQLSVTPSVTTTYTYTATNPDGCVITSAPLTINVTPLPSAPTATGSAQCGLGVPTASVTSTTGAASPVFRWYAAASGGTALQSGTSATYTTAINTTTTFYVAELLNACESVRTPVTVTVTTPDAITASAANAQLCAAGSTVLTVVNNGTANNYSYTWSATSPNAGLPATVTGASITVTPTVAGTYTYTVNGSDAATGCATSTTVNVTLNALPVITVSAVNPAVVCAGGTSTLTAVVGGPGSGTVGTDNATTKISTTGVPYRTGTTTGNQVRSQYLITASELSAAGLVAGNLSSLSFVVNSGGGGTMSNLDFRIAHTSATALTTSYLTPTFTTVLSLATYSPVVGTNAHSFTTPFNWDGVSNIIVEVCGTLTTGGSGCTMATTNTTYTATIGNSSTTGCTTATGSNTTNTRPVMIFGGTVGNAASTAALNWVWNPGNLNGNSVTVNPTTTTTYTVTATIPGTSCSSSATATVTVSPTVVTASAANTTICVGAGTSVSAAVSGGSAPFTYSWSDGTATIGNTATVSVTPSATTTYTVSVTDGCGNIVTSNVTVIVQSLPTVSINQSSPLSICGAGTQALTLTTNATNPTYQWKLDGVNITGVTSASFAPTTSGSYTVTVDNGTCNNTSAAIVVTINAAPPAITVTPATAAICAGAIQQLTANGSQVQLTVPSGTGTSTNATTGYPAPYSLYYGGVKHQFLFRASELSAMGMTTGSSITSLEYAVNALGSTFAGTLTDFRIDMGLTTTNVLSSSSFIQGLTNVLPAANLPVAVGTITHNLATPFVWDGTSNVVVQTSFSNNISGTSTDFVQMPYSTTSFVSSNWYRVDGATSATVLAATTPTSSSSNRTNVKFGFTNTATVTWAPTSGLYTDAAATVPYTGGAATTVYAMPTANATYTATAAYSSGCSVTASSVLTVNQPIVISTQPTGQTICAGAAINLSVTATGTGLTYQWKKNGVDITGATGATYTVASASAADAGSYTVVITGACGTQTSAAAVMIVNAQTIIGTQPQSQTACTGSSINLSVSATGSGTLTYQWKKNGTDIPGATAATYSIASLASGDAGSYTVVVTGTCGTVTSNAAVLTVSTSTTINTQPQPQTVCLGASATFTVTAAGSGTLTYQWKKNGVDIAGATNASYTIAATTAADAANYSVAVTSGCGTTTSTAVSLTLNPVTTISTQPTAQAVCAGGNASFTVAASGTAPYTYQWRKGGVAITGATNATYTITGVTAADVANYDVVVTGACGNATSNAVALSITPAATITTQPTAQTVCSGTATTFSVTATGAGITYQWRKAGVDIAGATNATYTIASTTVADAANYDVVITGTCNTVTSTAVALTVNGTPAITAQPTAQVTCAGSSATFSVTATGAGITYQWRKGGANIAGATNATYTIASATAADAANYDVVITGTCGSVTSSAVALTVNNSVVITTQPTAQTVCNGNIATFTVVATGGGLTYQWRKDGVALAGATAATLTITGATPANAGSYSVVITGTCGQATSNSVSLTVNTATVITTQPQSQVRCTAGPATFTVAATGLGTITYQWRFNGVPIPNATQASYTIPYVITANGGNYDVVVNSNCGPITSSAAVLTTTPCTSVPNVDAEIATASVMPNPVVGSSILRIKAQRAAEIKWQMVDMNGREVMKFNRQVSAGTTDVTLNMSNMAAGTYQLNGTLSNGKTITLRIVKM